MTASFHVTTTCASRCNVSAETQIQKTLTSVWLEQDLLVWEAQEMRLGSEFVQMCRVKGFAFSPDHTCFFMSRDCPESATGSAFLPLLADGMRLRDPQTAGICGTQCSRTGREPENELVGLQGRLWGLSLHFLTFLETPRTPTLLGLERPTHT